MIWPKKKIGERTANIIRKYSYFHKQVKTRKKKYYPNPFIQVTFVTLTSTLPLQISLKFCIIIQANDIRF